MKDQASLNLLIVDSPIDSKALTGHLMLRATSTGLKVYDATGSESELGGGASSWNDLADRPTYLTTPVNTANGVVQLDGSGLIPTSLIPTSTVDLSSYEGPVSLVANNSDKITLKYAYSSDMYTSAVTIEQGAINFDVNAGTVYFTGYGVLLGKIGETLQILMVNASDLQLNVNDLMLNDAGLNSANGLVQLGSDGKIPSSILPESAVDLSNYSAATIKLSSTSTFTASGAMTTDIGSTTGVTNIIGNTVRLHGTYGTTVGEAGELNLGGSSKNSLQPATQITVNVTDPANKLLLNNAKPNAANGFALVGSDGKLPASILPESSGGSVDLSDYVGPINMTSSDDVPVTIVFSSGNPTYNANLTMNAAGVTLAGYGDVSLEHTGGAYLRLSSGEVDLSSEGSLLLQSTSRLVINATEGVFLGAAGLNTAGGLVKLGEDGKIPSSLYEAGSAGATPQLMFTVPSNASGLHLEITAGKLADGTDNAALINTATSADHRAKVLGNSGGTDWITCPDTGFGTNFAGWPVKVDVTGLLDPSEISYIRYRWVPTTGDPSDWYAMVYPCATEAPIPSSGGSGGDITELDNRVTALESTVGSLDAAVDEILADYGEGSGALVYRVVASATEPENPTEGMIWIQTA